MSKFIRMLSAVALVAIFSSQVLAKEITVRGRLQKTVEPGGWVIASDNAKYLLLNADRFRNEEWFKESAAVEALGETKDVMTVYMEGTPFEARTVKPLEQAGSSAAKAATKVTVSGDSIVQAQPDTAILTISVVTQAKLALDAQRENATKTEAVIRTVKAATGSGAEVKTSGYSLQPQRIYRENQPPTITGYEARNSVTVTLSDLTKVGSVIDAAGQAGANDVAGIQFTLRHDRPARDEALKLATREAMSKAQVMAQALGGRVVRIVEVSEVGTVRPPIPVYELRGGMDMKASSTPIEVGALDVSAQVHLVAEIDIG